MQRNATLTALCLEITGEHEGRTRADSKRALISRLGDFKKKEKESVLIRRCAQRLKTLMGAEGTAQQIQPLGLVSDELVWLWLHYPRGEE